MNSILAVIPARGGSKGIPSKNITLIHGKPLIVYSIEQARAIPSFLITSRSVTVPSSCQKYRLEAWPSILARLETNAPDLWVVGRLDGADEHMLRFLKENKAICTGYVADLRTVLRPYDIHIVPWAFNTGVRTRIPLALRHKQVIVAMRRATECLPELIDGLNCLLIDDLSEAAGVIERLLNDERLRYRIADTGYHTFLSSYTREGVQARFDQQMCEYLGVDNPIDRIPKCSPKQ